MAEIFIPKKIVFVCLGNICRSPLAEGIMKSKVKAAGLGKFVEIESRGIGIWARGLSPDKRSIDVARKRGIDISGHRGAMLRASELDKFDLFIAMDVDNYFDISEMARWNKKIKYDGFMTRLYLMRDFDHEVDAAGKSVPDPYEYGPREFEYIYKILDRCSDGLLKELIRTYSLDTFL